MTYFNRRKFLQGLATSSFLLASGERAFAAATHTMPPAITTPGFNPEIEL